MKNIFLVIEYVGTAYFGSQLQSVGRQKTIQSVMEEALETLFRKKVRIIFAGRTDRGVHARGQAANFILDTSIPLANIKTALNSLLPADIRVKAVKYAPADFHARFWAKAKHYRYFIHNSKQPSVFWHDRAWHINAPLNIAAMRKIAAQLTGRKDFSLFAKEAKKYKDTFRHIQRINIRKKGSFVTIDIYADGFMRAMARNLVSFMVKVGASQLTLKQASDILNDHLAYTNKPAPAHGLYLWKVIYPAKKGKGN